VFFTVVDYYKINWWQEQVLALVCMCDREIMFGLKL